MLICSIFKGQKGYMIPILTRKSMILIICKMYKRWLFE
jgi:hypothetical protein